MRPERHLVVFLRAPQLGRVKSRLAAGIGALAALRFYRDTSARLLRALARDGRWRLELWVTPDRAVGGRWPVKAPRRGQGAGDLGRRMARVFATLPPGPAVIVGSDIPALTPAHIAAAFGALGRAEAVFGPATDGGYWLVGLRRRSARTAWPLPECALVERRRARRYAGGAAARDEPVAAGDVVRCRRCRGLQALAEGLASGGGSRTTAGRKKTGR